MHLDPMRKAKCTSPPGGGGSQINGFTRTAVLAVIMSMGVVLWQHFLDAFTLRQQTTLSDQVQYVLLDAMLAVPFAAAAVWVADRVVTRATTWRQHATYAAAASLSFSALMIPLVDLQARVQTLVYTGDDHAHHAAALNSGLAGLVGYGLRYALVGEPVAFVLALLTVSVFLAPFRLRPMAGPLRRAGTIAVAAATAIVMTGTTGSAAQAATGGSATPDTNSTAATSTGG